MLGQLTSEQINSVLSSQAVGRLACTDGRQPYIVPVTYTYDGICIYGQTNDGKKLEVLRKNNNVCFEVDRMTDMQNWQSVVVYGSFEELTGDDIEKGREILFGHIFSLMTSSTVHYHEQETAFQLDDSNRVKQVMYRIKIKEMTGRFENQS